MTQSVPGHSLASDARQTMCVGEQMGGGQAYRMPLAMWFEGDLDVTALVAACGDVVARHPMRAHLAAIVPAHLVPSVWVPLDEPPLTVTGKVDLTALPAPDPAAVAQFVPPYTDAEVLVAGVMATVLGLDAGRVGAVDDFFTLGGHSLPATRVAALLRNALDVDVPIRTVFDRPAVADLAIAVENLLIEQLSGLSDAEDGRALMHEANR